MKDAKQLTVGDLLEVLQLLPKEMPCVYYNQQAIGYDAIRIIEIADVVETHTEFDWAAEFDPVPRPIDGSVKAVRGLVTDRTFTHFEVLWCCAKPKPIMYTISEPELWQRMSFYANWEDFNTVPVHTHNTLNKF